MSELLKYLTLGALTPCLSLLACLIHITLLPHTCVLSISHPAPTMSSPLSRADTVLLAQFFLYLSPTGLITDGTNCGGAVSLSNCQTDRSSNGRKPMARIRVHNVARHLWTIGFNLAGLKHDTLAGHLWTLQF